MAITLLQPFNLDSTANYTFNEVTVSSNVNMSLAGNITLGNVSNIHISGGTANYVLRTDGAGNLSWVAQSGGGGAAAIAIQNEGNTITNSVTSINFVGSGVDATAIGDEVTVIVSGGGGSGSPGGTNTQVQFNDLGSFGGNAGFTFNKTTGILAVPSVTGAILPRVVVISDGTSVTINSDITDMATQTNTQPAGTLTIDAPTGTPFNGQKLTFRLQSANVQTFSWNAIFTASTDLPLPATSTGGNAYDYLGFVYNSTATQWQLLAKNFGF